MLRFGFAVAVGLLVFALLAGSSSRPAIAWDCMVCSHGQARYGPDPYMDEELYFWWFPEMSGEQDPLDGFDRGGGKTESDSAQLLGNPAMNMGAPKAIRTLKSKYHGIQRR